MKWAPARIAALSAVALAGCSPDSDAPEGPIRAGFSQEPPFAFVDRSGTVRGEAPEALRRAAAALGLPEPEWTRLDFDELLPALRAGRIDVAASGHLITPARAEAVAFTRPTACLSPALLVRSEREGVGSLQDVVADATSRVVVLGGSIESESLHRTEVDPGRVLRVADSRSALVALQTGASDAFAISLPTARWLAGTPEGDGLVVVGPYTPPTEVADLLAGCTALALRPGSSDLLGALNRVLPGVLADSAHRARLRELGFDSIPAPGAREPRG